MKQLLKVARMGHPVLREVADPVPPDRIGDREFQDFVDSMLMTMHEYEGVGLAAPQVHASIRLVVLHQEAGLTDAEERPIVALINPQITPLTDETSAMWEGCLSLPGLRGRVSRPDHVRVQGLDRNGNRVDLELEGFPAVVIQHECDHLDGVLYVDRLDDTKKLAFEKEFERYLMPQAEADDEMIGD